MISINEKTIANDERFLRQISAKVKNNDLKNLQEEIKLLKKYCEENGVLALASVQIGIPKRLIYVKNTNLEIVNKIQFSNVSDEEKKYDEKKVLINPVITKKIGLTDYWEACASCLDYCGRVLRPYKIEVEFYDEYFRQQKATFEGFEATVLAHEIDHLDGILHIDIAIELLNMPVEKRKLWRQTHPYQIYEKENDYELLKEEYKKSHFLN